MSVMTEVDVREEQQDLVAILAFKFGLVSDSMQKSIRSIDNGRLLQDLIETAKDVETWDQFAVRFKQCMSWKRGA